jgi:hypothetical protein
MRPHGALICCRSRDVIGWTHAFMYVRCVHEQNGANLELLYWLVYNQYGETGKVIKNYQLKLTPSNMYYVNCELVLLVPFKYRESRNATSKILQNEWYDPKAKWYILEPLVQGLAGFIFLFLHIVLNPLRTVGPFRGNYKKWWNSPKSGKILKIMGEHESLSEDLSNNYQC